MNIQRRTLLLTTAGILTASTSSSIAKTLMATPGQAAGPFYPDTLPLDDDNDLTYVSGHSAQAKGIISDVSGRIVDINGHPLKGIRIEIWQCDAFGRYRHPQEQGSREPDHNFQGHGFNVTNVEGRYRFRTIKPVQYPGRTPHIHIAVFAPGETPFVTQLYIQDDPRNAQDFLFNRVPAERRHLVMAEFQRSNQPDTELKAQFDIVLNRSDGTPQHI